MSSLVRKRDPVSDFNVWAQDRRPPQTPGREGIGKNPSNRLPSESKHVTNLRADLHRSIGRVIEFSLEERIDLLASTLEEMRPADRELGGTIAANSATARQRGYDISELGARLPEAALLSSTWCAAIAVRTKAKEATNFRKR